ncbi:MAG: UbiD family decarboxylase, partial [Chloroflexi bacterium]
MPYTDLRDWLRQVDEMGELRYVNGATLDEDVGRITEMLQHTDDAPAALLGGFEGYP